MNALPIVAVVGCGFVGSHVVTALARQGITVVPLSAPRLHTVGRTTDELSQDLGRCPELDGIVGQLRGVDIVVNAAGLADAARGLDDSLVGANAVLPGVLQRATARAGARLFIHVSSASVQGPGPLDETRRLAPFSPYSQTKAWGETLLDHDLVPTVVYRPTSVHGKNRAVSASLARFARSRWSCVAGMGDAPTPQVLAQNVGEAVAFLAASRTTAPPIVLHPWEGLTAEHLLTVLGLGRRPAHIPDGMARVGVGLLSVSGHASPRLRATWRRLDMLWYGQPQARTWLESMGFRGTGDQAAWTLLAAELAADDTAPADSAT